MMNKIILFLMVSLVGCGIDLEQTKYEKPFVIIGKTSLRTSINEKYIPFCEFKFECNRGYRRSFDDRCDKYSVGDTIR